MFLDSDHHLVRRNQHGIAQIGLKHVPIFYDSCELTLGRKLARMIGFVLVIVFTAPDEVNHHFRERGYRLGLGLTSQSVGTAAGALMLADSDATI